MCKSLYLAHIGEICMIKARMQWKKMEIIFIKNKEIK